MVLQNYQNFTEMASNMLYIFAFGCGLKCPHKIHLNIQCPTVASLRFKIYIFQCFFQFLVPYSKSPLSSSMGANQKPAKIPQNEEVDRIELRKNDESARINLEKAKSKYSDKMKTLKTKMKKVREEQKDLETNLIKFNAFVKEKQLKVKLSPI